MELSREDREQIFNEVLHEHYVEDAKDYVYMYFDSNEEEYAKLFDFEALAKTFERRYDPNLSHYEDMWNYLIEEYMEDNGIEID